MVVASATTLESYGTPAGTTIPFAGQLVRQNDTGTGPKAYLNWLVFDKSFEVIASKRGFRRLSNVPKESGTNVPHEKLEMPEVTIEEAGYVYIYFSNENETFVEVYFDDFSVTHTPTNIVQYNEYYPFGLQTANSWSREEVMPNAFLYNGGSELNSVTNNYEMFFREYDPTLGRMNAIDPMASKYASLSPYNYAFNDPVYFNDPSGADPAYQRSDDTWWAGPRSGWGKWSYGGPGAFANEQRLLAMERSSVAMYMSGGDFSSDGGYFGRLGLSHSTTIEFGFNSVGEAGYWVDSNSGTHTGLNTDNGTIYLQGDVVKSTRFVKIDNDNQLNQGGGVYLTGTAPFSLYNGALRMYYEYSAASLKGYYTGADGVIDYARGSDARYGLKSKVRALTLEPQRGILNKLDPLRATTKATPRFWKTNASWNVAGKLSVAGGAFGIAVAGYRIANAENKLSETGKVASGFAGAWIGMQAVGPLAAAAGAVSGPAAPFVSGGILLIGGAAGALGAEWVFDQF